MHFTEGDFVRRLFPQYVRLQENRPPKTEAFNLGGICIFWFVVRMARFD